MLDERPKKSSVLSLVLMLILFIGGLMWLVPAVMSSDPRWFLKGDLPAPQRIVIWNAGRTLTLQPGDPDFVPVAADVTAALNYLTAYSDFGPSPQTIADYRNRLALEAYYAGPLQFHSQFSVGRPRQVMFPLVDSGYKEGRFFIGADDKYWAGGPRTAGLSGIYAEVAQVLRQRGIAISD